MIGTNWLGTLRLRFRKTARRTRTAARRRMRHGCGRLGGIEALESRTLLSAAPAIASFDLYQDTGTPGDYITNNPTVTGTVSATSPAEVTMEFDYTGDGIAEDWTSLGSNGVFIHDPSSHLTYGSVTIAVRASTFDWDTWTENHSAWATLSFTWYNEPPQIAAVGILNPVAGYPGVTLDGLIAGSVTNPDGGVSGLYVEVDYTGDGIPDDYTLTDPDGSFTYDMSPMAGHGIHTLQFRAAESDAGQHVAGDWVSLEVHYPAPPHLIDFSATEIGWHEWKLEGSVAYYDYHFVTVKFSGVVNAAIDVDWNGTFWLTCDIDYSGPLTVVAVDQFGRESNVWEDYIFAS